MLLPYKEEEEEEEQETVVVVLVVGEGTGWVSVCVRWGMQFHKLGFCSLMTYLVQPSLYLQDSCDYRGQMQQLCVTHLAPRVWIRYLN